MSEESGQDEIQKPNALIKWLVGGLPLGLIVMGVLSFVIWFHKKKERAPIVSEFAAMLQKDVNTADFDRYVRIIAEEIGRSNMSEGEKGEAVATFVESSMSMDNMGYEMLRKGYENDGLAIYGELPGKNRSAPPVVLVAQLQDAYKDRSRANCLAAMMSVAHSLTGTQQTRTIRYAIVLGSEADQDMTHKAGGVIRLQGLEDQGLAGANEQIYTVEDGRGNLLGMLQGLKQSLETAASR